MVKIQYNINIIQYKYNNNTILPGSPLDKNGESTKVLQILIDSRDSWLLRFESKTRKDRIMSTEVAAQLLLAEIFMEYFHERGRQTHQDLRKKI